MKGWLAGLAAAGLLLGASSCVSMAGQAAGAAAEEATQPIVDESLDALSDPENRAQIAQLLASPELRRASANITAGAIDGMLVALSSEERAQEMAPQLGLLAHEIARQVTLGIDSALADVSQRPAPQTGIGQILSGAETATMTSAWLLPAVIGLLALALVVAIALLMRGRSRARREREQAARREEAVLLLATAFKDAEREPWGPELRELLKRRVGDRGGADYLGTVLGERGADGADRH